MTGMFLATAGYATFATGVLPKWTGLVAYVGAALCVACVPAMYFMAHAPGYFLTGGRD